MVHVHTWFFSAAVNHLWEATQRIKIAIGNLRRHEVSLPVRRIIAGGRNNPDEQSNFFYSAKKSD